MRSMIPRGFVSTRLRRWYPLHFRQSDRPRYFVARRTSLRAMAPEVSGFQGFAFLRGGITAFAPRSAPLVHVNMHCRAVDGIVALSGVIGAVCGDTANLLIGRDMAEQFGQHRCIADIASGELDCPNFQCFLVDPEVNLTPDAAFGAAMLAGISLTFALDLDPGAVHCPAGYCAAMSREGMSRCNGPCEPRYGMFTAKVFCRRDTVLKSGTDQSIPLNSKRLSTKPVVCLSAMPNRTFIPSRALPRNTLPGSGQSGLDRQRAPALQRFVVGPPVPNLVGRGDGLLIPPSYHAGFSG